MSGVPAHNQLVQSQMLDEIQAGIFDGWTYEQIEQQMPQEYAARKKDKLKYRSALDYCVCHCRPCLSCG